MLCNKPHLSLLMMKISMLYGDVPLITKETLERLIAVKPAGGIGLLTVIL